MMAEAMQMDHVPVDRYRVLIVDDHALLNEMLTAALARNEGFDVAAATSVEAALDLIRREGPYDAVLVDFDGPGMDGLKGLARISEANGGGVALFSGVASASVVERAVKMGASGYIPKTMQIRSVGRAVRFIADGEVYLPSDMILRKPLEGEIAFGLKPREARVLSALCEGLQNKEIGAALEIEETTVKMDVRAICIKMGVRNRTEAVIKALKQGGV
jgi:DNA-binding NarL/FixJ family response regulator